MSASSLAYRPSHSRVLLSTRLELLAVDAETEFSQPRVDQNLSQETSRARKATGSCTEQEN